MVGYPDGNDLGGASRSQRRHKRHKPRAGLHIRYPSRADTPQTHPADRRPSCQCRQPTRRMEDELPDSRIQMIQLTGKLSRDPELRSSASTDAHLAP